MRIAASHGGLTVSAGSRFSSEDIERLRDALAAFQPCSRLALDFGEVREADDATLAALARMLGQRPWKELQLRGLTLHQRGILVTCGVVRSEGNSSTSEGGTAVLLAPGTRRVGDRGERGEARDSNTVGDELATPGRPA